MNTRAVRFSRACLTVRALRRQKSGSVHWHARVWLVKTESSLMCTMAGCSQDDCSIAWFRTGLLGAPQKRAERRSSHLCLPSIHSEGLVSPQSTGLKLGIPNQTETGHKLGHVELKCSYLLPRLISISTASVLANWWSFLNVGKGGPSGFGESKYTCSAFSSALFLPASPTKRTRVSTLGSISVREQRGEQLEDGGGHTRSKLTGNGRMMAIKIYNLLMLKRVYIRSISLLGCLRSLLSYIIIIYQGNPIMSKRQLILMKEC